MPVTIIPASAAGLPSEVWTFDAPEPPVHPALGNVSVDGAICVTGVSTVANDVAIARVAVTVQREWAPYAERFSERAREDLGRMCINLAAHGAVTDGLRHVTHRRIGR